MTGIHTRYSVGAYWAAPKGPTPRVSIPSQTLGSRGHRGGRKPLAPAMRSCYGPAPTRETSLTELRHHGQALATPPRLLLPMQRAVWIQALRSQTRSFPHPSQVKRSHRNRRHPSRPRLEAASETGRVKPEPPAASRWCCGAMPVGETAQTDVTILITLPCHCPVT